MELNVKSSAFDQLNWLIFHCDFFFFFCGGRGDVVFGGLFICKKQKMYISHCFTLKMFLPVFKNTCKT